MDINGNNSNETENHKTTEAIKEVDEPIYNDWYKAKYKDSRLSIEEQIQIIKSDNELKKMAEEAKKLKFLKGISSLKFLIITMLILVSVNTIISAIVGEYDNTLIISMMELLKTIVPVLIGYLFGKKEDL